MQNQLNLIQGKREQVSVTSAVGMKVYNRATVEEKMGCTPQS